MLLLEKEGKTQAHSTIRKHIMETTSQSRPVWVYSRVLMMLRPLANCCVLAEKWNVNGSTCDCKLHRGATELTAPSVYLGHNMSICMFAGMHQRGVMPTLINSI